ncbi:MAG TPA: hypothetical protein VF757_03820 [Sphingomicrobium sp.]
MTQAEREYYLARIAAERAAAEQASNDRARTIHLDLAEQYQRIVDGREPLRSPE